MVSCQEPSPLKGSKHCSQCHPHDAALVNALSLCSWGQRQGVAHPKSAAHCRHMKRQPFLHGRLHRGCLLCHGCCHLCLQHHRHRHCRCCCRRRRRRNRHRRCCGPLLRLPWQITADISVALPSAIAVAIALAVGHCRLHHRRPSQLPLPSAITVTMPSAISESCCLGAARIVFDQSKQRMLTLFYFVGTVGGILIEAGSLTRCWAAMANTSVGRRAVSSERLVRELAGGWGAAG